MTNKATVSVCINCYNAERTIEDCVASVLRQSYEHLQVIVVDDGSTDRTREILGTFDDDRLTCVFLEENGHIANANNEALRRCEGKYVAHLDADDVWFPEKLAVQVAFLEENPAYGAVFSASEAVDEHLRPVEDDRYRAVNKPQAAMLRHLLEHGNFLNHSSMLARREVIGQVGEHDVSLLYLHDYDYWVRLCTVCPIYVWEEPLLLYRIQANSNSNRKMTATRFGAHMIEHARIQYRAILRCPEALFREAFGDRLRRPELPPTKERTEIEKAFVLMDQLTHLPQNPALGLRRMAELINEPLYREQLRREYGLSPREFYQLQETVVFHNEAEMTHYRNVAANSEAALEATTAQYRAYRADSEAERAMLAASLAAAQEHERQLEAANEELSQTLARITSSRWWRLGAPLRRLRRQEPAPTDKTPVKVMVYGFFGHNLGDDLFLDRLFKRYPDTAFTVWDAECYEDFLAAYPNVRGVTRADAAAAAVDAETFERRLLGEADAVVHIGGSVYQQIGDWETDMTLREKRYDPSRPFFSISANFGPFHTEDYRRFWKTQFEKAGDVCFRDTYSASLFEGVETVRVAPDLLFSQPLPAVEREEDRLFVSLIDPAASHRTFSKAVSDGYYRTVTATVTQWLQDGGTVHLSAFCPYEGDMEAVQRVKNGVPEAWRDRLFETIYTSTVEAARGVVDALCRSSHVLATRFHAMVFGLAVGARTVPLCYNEKMNHALQDMAFDGTVLSLEDTAALSAAELVACLRAQKPFDVTKQRRTAVAQFDALDAFLTSRDATVKEEIE